MNLNPRPKVYLGDSVYAEIRNGMLTLTTWNGLGDTNTIHLEPEVLNALLRYLAEPGELESP